MQKYVIFFEIFAVFAVGTLSLYAQLDDEMVCGHIDDEETMLMKTSEMHNSSFINPNPNGKNYKVAVLYFKAANDNFDASDTSIYSDETHCRVMQWPLDSAGPNWMGELLISNA